jgi:hypothetical protein
MKIVPLNVQTGQVGVELHPLRTALILIGVLTGLIVLTFAHNTSQVSNNININSTKKVGQFTYLIGGETTTKKLIFVMATAGLLGGISYLLPKILETKTGG